MIGRPYTRETTLIFGDMMPGCSSRFPHVGSLTSSTGKSSNHCLAQSNVVETSIRIFRPSFHS